MKKLLSLLLLLYSLTGMAQTPVIDTTTYPTGLKTLGKHANDSTYLQQVIRDSAKAIRIANDSAQVSLLTIRGLVHDSLSSSTPSSADFYRQGNVLRVRKSTIEWDSITNKPTTLAAAGLANAAPSFSPTFIGVPLAPTAPVQTNTSQIATTAFVKAAVNFVNSGGGVAIFDSLRVLTSPPTTGNIYFNSLTNKIGVKNPAGTYWLYYSPDQVITFKPYPLKSTRKELFATTSSPNSKEQVITTK